MLSKKKFHNNLYIILVLSSFFIIGCNSTENSNSNNPWASFKVGSWVDVHTYHKMKMLDTAGEENISEWSGDSRMTVLEIGANNVLVGHFIESKDLNEEILLQVPAIDAFNDVRSLGQWPHDIFPMGPERQAGLTAKEKNPIAQNNLQKKSEETQNFLIDGNTYEAKLITKEWDFEFEDGIRHYIMQAWVSEGIELPLKWGITTSDGKEESETELIKLKDFVDVNGNDISCFVTETKKKTRMGDMVKKRWSSKEMPGFMVKMETRIESPAFSLIVNEWITDFSTN